VHRASVIRADGAVLASASSDNGAAEWWAGFAGVCAVGTKLFAPTDQGVVRIGLADGALRIDTEFPDTEPFVTTDHRLLAGPDGLYVIGRNDISRLEIR